MSCTTIFLASIIVYGVESIKVGSYNTFQIVTNPLASTLLEPQIQQIGESDVDVLCLQELSTMPSLIQYITNLAD